MPKNCFGQRWFPPDAFVLLPAGLVRRRGGRCCSFCGMQWFNAGSLPILRLIAMSCLRTQVRPGTCWVRLWPLGGFEMDFRHPRRCVWSSEGRLASYSFRGCKGAGTSCLRVEASSNMPIIFGLDAACSIQRCAAA